MVIPSRLLRRPILAVAAHSPCMIAPFSRSAPRRHSHWRTESSRDMVLRSRGGHSAEAEVVPGVWTRTARDRTSPHLGNTGHCRTARTAAVVVAPWRTSSEDSTANMKAGKSVPGREWKAINKRHLKGSLGSSVQSLTCGCCP